MILSSLKQTSRLKDLHPLFDKLFDYISSHDMLSLPLGRIEIQGDDLFINNVECNLLPSSEQVLELHHEYIDVHIPLNAVEIIGWKSSEELTDVKTEYDKNGDYALYTDQPTTWLNIQPGEFVVMFPEDAHAPLIGEGKIRKLIAKVRI